ncbi:MAG: hypothetical protein Q8O89_08165 [Nanoarchaeota archaeon]|nr:hypothetical protein [Nanoarchaeota archaeon]
MESQILPDVEQAADISIVNQKEKDHRDNPSWNIVEEERTLMELMNEDANSIYKENK